MLIKQSPTHLYARLVIVVALSLNFCGRAHSTTIAVLEIKDGFVILSDSKETPERSNQATCRGDVKKIFIVQDRFAFFATGKACVHGTYRDNGVISEISYDINGAWVQELQNSLPKNVSLEQLVKGIKSKFSNLPPKLQGSITSRNLPHGDPLNVFEPFLTLVIVGYDEGFPAICVLKFYVDWYAQRFVEVPPIAVDFQPSNRNMGFHIFGYSEAVTDILNPKSYAYGQAMTACPEAFGDFVSGRPVSLDESASIGRVMIQIEEKVSPNNVGGKIQGVQILASGKATELTNILTRLPKANTRKQKQKH
jgi:hypothetical protein